MLLVLLMKKKKEKASFRIITKTSISVQDTQILCHIVSHVTSFNYLIITILYIFKM